MNKPFLLGVICPICKSPVGKQCRSKEGRPKKSHGNRIRNAILLREIQRGEEIGKEIFYEVFSMEKWLEENIKK